MAGTSLSANFYKVSNKMLGKIKSENLGTYIRKIEALFPDFVDEANIVAKSDIVNYYAESFWGYALFHSWSGAIHMALSKSGKFSKNDYFRQSEEVESAINSAGQKEIKNVLEVGCGRGYNLRFLANRFPDIKFQGRDLSSKNVHSAVLSTKNTCNIEVLVDDFHELNSIPDNSVDLIFAVETLCHATDLETALKAISRKLSQGGRLIVFDGFRGRSLVRDTNLEKAVRYTEKAMAVPEFKSLQEFETGAKDAGLELEYANDRSTEILPNLVRLSDFAKAFFKIGPLSRIILRVLPHGLVTNAVAGLLMAVTVNEGAHTYYKMQFVKR